MSRNFRLCFRWTTPILHMATGGRGSLRAFLTLTEAFKAFSLQTKHVGESTKNANYLNEAAASWSLVEMSEPLTGLRVTTKSNCSDSFSQSNPSPSWVESPVRLGSYQLYSKAPRRDICQEAGCRGLASSPGTRPSQILLPSHIVGRHPVLLLFNQEVMFMTVLGK
ncbi:unnamed protein product [Pleuronectes platessa]|uniref:Uncharacterized protein n=1 Tax=Pleuronectes platessa TaxID=8262 RepID=A0A9N7UQY6_PLEPL|nr:unnamed protein product [Pleuronectes platessa]